MPDAKPTKFRDLAKGDTFVYNGSAFRKVASDLAADPNDDARVTPFRGDFMVEPRKVEADKPTNSGTDISGPTGDGLDDLTVEQLRGLADEHNVEHKSSDRKADLVAALRTAAVSAPTE